MVGTNIAKNRKRYLFTLLKIVKVKKEPIIIPKKTWAGIAVQRPIIVLIISLVPSDDPGSPTAIALAIAEDKYTNASSSAKPSPAIPPYIRPSRGSLNSLSLIQNKKITKYLTNSSPKATKI